MVGSKLAAVSIWRFLGPPPPPPFAGPPPLAFPALPSSWAWIVRAMQSRDAARAERSVRIGALYLPLVIPTPRRMLLHGHVYAAREKSGACILTTARP